MKFVNKYLKDNITLKNNQIELTPETTRAIKRFNRVMDKFFSENKTLEKYLVESSRLIKEGGDLNVEFHKSQRKSYSIAGTAAERNLILNDYLDNIKGLNEEFKNPVRTQIRENLVRRKSFTEIREDMRKLIVGDDKKKGLMRKHLETNARVASGAYIGVTNQDYYNKAKSDVKFIGVSGTLIATSAPQCITCIKIKGKALRGFDKKTNEKFKKYTDVGYDQKVPIEDFEKIILPLAEKNGLIEGTTINNVFKNRLHWNCRHDFTPLTT